MVKDHDQNIKENISHEQHSNQNIHETEDPQDMWIKPDYYQEMGEIKRTANTFAKNNKELYTEILTNFAEQLPQAELEPLTDEIWSNLENTDSYHNIQKNDFDKVAKLAEGYNRKWLQKLESMKSNSPLEAPTIFKMDDKYHKVSGNTRLMLARALGLRPKAIFVRFNKQNI